MTDTAQNTRRSDWLDGFRDTLPVMIAIVPFAALFGALAREAGFSLAAVMVTSATIYAGASQYVMLDLLGRGAAPWAIVLAVFVLNFRHVLYSASLGRRMDDFGPVGRYVAFFFLVDPLYGAAEKRRRSNGLRPAYYVACALALYSVWILSNLAGALFGGLIDDPARYGLDFILPLYFVSLLLSFRQSAHFSIIMVASAGVSLATWGLFDGTWYILTGGGAGLFLAAMLSKPPEAVS